MTYDMTHKMYNVENENSVIKMKIMLLNKYIMSLASYFSFLIDVVNNV